MRQPSPDGSPDSFIGWRTGWRAACSAGLGLLALGLGFGCGDSNLQPAGSVHYTEHSGDPKNADIEKMIVDHETERAPGTPVLPIFMIGDDYRMLELPGNDAQPAGATDNARNIPVAFMIPASADSATGRPETLQQIAVGVLILDDSQPQKIYRLADFSRVKLAGQICNKAFSTYAKETGVKLPDTLTLQEGYPAIFSAAYIYRDVDMIEETPAPPPSDAKGTAAGDGKMADTNEDINDDDAKARRNVRIIRTRDIESFLKENKADVLALMVVQIDDRNKNEQLVALWLWSHDPVTHTLFKPSACVQSNKIDLRWPEATDNEQVHMWHSLIDLERRLAEQKTVVVDHAHKTMP